MHKNINQKIKLIIGFIIYVYEELFLIPAKKILKFFQKFNIYEKMIIFFSQNIFLNVVFLILTLTIAETSAIIAGYFFINKKYILGIFFYILKVILFIPLVDLFKRNKRKLLSIKTIRTIYYYYLQIRRLPIFYKLKRIKKEIKLKIKEIKNNFKNKIILILNKIDNNK